MSMITGYNIPNDQNNVVKPIVEPEPEPEQEGKGFQGILDVIHLRDKTFTYSICFT